MGLMGVIMFNKAMKEWEEALKPENKIKHGYDISTNKSNDDSNFSPFNSKFSPFNSATSTTEYHAIGGGSNFNSLF